MTADYPHAGKEELLQYWNLDWPILKVLIGGQSSIDLPELSVRSWEDATEFLRSYGYDAENPRDQRVLHSSLIEAVSFIERFLMPDEWRRGVMPDDDILQCDDLRHLLLWASRLAGATEQKQAWSCAILRLMHTIAHMEGVQRAADFEIARKQVMERFQRYIFLGPDGSLWLGDSEWRIPLEKLEWKTSKLRESILLKLLHKRANVAETIYDLLGVRIVTKHLADTMLVVKFLQRFYMVTFPNCNPSRARNTLFDADVLRRQIDHYALQLERDEITAEEFHSLVEGIEAPIIDVERSNPHSAMNYRAVQFTCRQMIRWPNPLLQWMDFRSAVRPHEKSACDSFYNLVQGWQGVREDHELAAFFPFEVQIMDERAYRQNQFGDAAHDRYKKAQTRTARRRILARVLELHGS